MDFPGRVRAKSQQAKIPFPMSIYMGCHQKALFIFKVLLFRKISPPQERPVACILVGSRSSQTENQDSPPQPHSACLAHLISVWLASHSNQHYPDFSGLPIVCLLAIVIASWLIWWSQLLLVPFSGYPGLLTVDRSRAQRIRGSTRIYSHSWFLSIDLLTPGHYSAHLVSRWPPSTQNPGFMLHCC